MELTAKEMKSLRAFSDQDLNLPERWFTGKEWANGTAQAQIAQDYREALIAAKELRS